MYHTSFERANQLLIASYKCFFFIFGNFGNIFLIYLIISKKQLRSKSSLLQAIQSFCHVMCLCGTMVDSYLSFRDIQLPRNECYNYVSSYVFFEMAQSMLMLFLVLDILIIVKLPHFYRHIATWKYLIIMTIPAIIFGLIFLIWGFIELNDDIIIFCNPPLALHPQAAKLFARSILFLNFLTLLVFLVLIYIFSSRKGRNQRSESMKVMKRLRLSVIIFISSWFISQSAASIFIVIGLSGILLNFLVANMSFFVLLSFSQTFYVVMYSSLDYRRCFMKLWPLGRSKIQNAMTKENTKNSSTKHNTTSNLNQMNVYSVNTL